MTEAEWLACTDPWMMLEFLRGKASDRKFRLFACACCRRIWHLLKNERSQGAVEVAERFAEGKATVQELRRAEESANRVWNELAYAEENVTDAETDASDAACGACFDESAIESAKCASENAVHALSYVGQQSVEQRGQCHLIRDVFGSPFRPTTIDPSWLRWNDGTVPRIAQGIYDERAFDRLPILHDALLDAGCDNDDILAHCRGAGPHVRGCWVIDLILGKS